VVTEATTNRRDETPWYFISLLPPTKIHHYFLIFPLAELNRPSCQGTWGMYFA
jgi:hypothetical protein